MAPTVTSYDPQSLNEQHVSLPSEPLVVLAPNVVLQPPLTRHGKGPGLIIFLPQPDPATANRRKCLDPEPVAKWAEEGFAVVGVTTSEGVSVEGALKQGLDALQALDKVDVKDKFGVIVYDPRVIYVVSDAASKEPRIAALAGYGSFAASSLIIPILLHLTANAPRPAHPPSDATKVWTYNNTSASFVLPQSPKYDPGNAALAHSRTLVFLRKGLGGPFFDLEAIWDEHTYYEFEERSVAKTMGTMVAEPYVNHVPTMTGGVGRENLTAFYRDHFIFSNPADVNLEVISRTVGTDRVVDEFICHITHDRTVDWLLPNVPPTGKKLSIPMMAVVNIRGDRLYNEHIWWDQATALRQAGILPSHLPFSDPKTGLTSSLRLPVVGAEGAEMLADESKGKSNEMLDPQWAAGSDT